VAKLTNETLELSRGLRNYWYPVLRLEDLADGPVGIERLCEKLVVWRDEDGIPRVFVDRCAHRAAPLSLGDIVDGRLQCRYHGLQYDGTGQCRLAPIELQQDGPHARRLQVRSYPTQILGGMIWAYLGDVEKFPPPDDIDTDDAVTDPEFVSIVTESVWDANWLLVHDNTIDPFHLPFLHGHMAARIYEKGRLELEPAGPGNPIVTPAMAFDTASQRFTVQRTDRGIQMNLEGGEHKTFDSIEFDLPCAAKVWVPLPDGGPAYRIIQYEYPINEDKTIVYAWHGRRVHSDEEREHTLRVLQTFLAHATAQVYTEDSWICEYQNGLQYAWENEKLLPTDNGISALRKRLHEALHEQKTQLAAQPPSAGTPNSQSSGIHAARPARSMS
jgi:phenylpropionate dioxygenase-like ring-hydroxylating dioxygenase large terminal subunit